MGEGEELRHARKAAGVSLAAIARAGHFSVSHLSNIEAGRRLVTPDVLLAYARVLGEDCMNRRTVLAGLAGGALAPIVAGQLIREGFTAALSGRAAAENWAGRVAGYGQDYMAVGANVLRSQLTGDLVVIQQHLDQPQMWANAARMLAVYGKTTGEPAEAIEWYQLAAIAADRSGDVATRIWVRARAAIALAYEGARLDIAAQLATAATELSDRPSLGRVNALMAAALIAAGHGDVSTARQADDEGRRVFDLVASADAEISDFAVPPWRMATYRSMLYARLGDVRRGEPVQQEADATRPDGLPRFATHIELHRALMMVRSGDTTGGLAYGRHALAALPPERHSQSLRLMLAEVESAAA